MNVQFINMISTLIASFSQKLLIPTVKMDLQKSKN